MGKQKNKKQVVNNITPETKTIKLTNDNEVSDYLYKNKPVSIDFSYKTSFCSCEDDQFNNYLRNANDFIFQIRNLSKLLIGLSGKSLSELIPPNTTYRHCHQADHQQRAQNIIKRLCKNEDYYKQNFENEKIFQLGIADSLRLYGTIKQNIFSVAFIDYFHTYDFDQTLNKRKIESCRFCPMTSDLNN